MEVREGSMWGDGCPTHKDRVNGATKDHVAMGLQFLVVAKPLEYLPC